MAGVNTSVSVRDNMSAAFGNIANAINVCLGSYIELQAATDSGFDTEQIEAARAAILNIQDAANQLDKEIQDAEQSQQQFNHAASQGTTAMDGMLKKMLGIVAAYASWRALGAVIETADEMTNVTARIDMMNDGLESTEEVMNRIYQSAQRARGSYTDMATVVAKLGNNARDAFGSTEEIIAFAEIIQKSFVTSGASATEASNAMLQLTQALASGVLRGDELRSVMEQAPAITNALSEYLGVTKGEIREIAADGLITADIVKNAMFDAADEINTKFESMPMTWAQVGQSISNQALITFQPILDMISEVTQMEEFEIAVQGVTQAFAGLAQVAMPIVQDLIQGAAWIVTNWSQIAPIISPIVTIIGILTIAMAGYKVAQLAVNAAMYACPLTWILLAIIAVIAAIYVIIGVINDLSGSTVSATGVIVGTITAAGAIIWNLIYGLFSFCVGIGVELYNLIAVFANFFANVFDNPVMAIIDLFMGLFDVVVGIVESCARVIDALLGSDMSSAISEFRNDMSAAVDMIVGEQTVVMEKASQEEIMAKIGFERLNVGDSFDWGYNAGAAFESGIEGLFDPSTFDAVTSGLGDIGEYGAETAGNTSAIADSLEITEDNLVWLKDIAEREVIDRTVFRDIKVDLGGVNNTVNNMADLDGIGEYIADSIAEKMASSAEGV